MTTLPPFEDARLEFRKTSHLPDLLLGFLAIMLSLDIFLWIVFIPIALRGRADFRHLYAAGYMVRTGQRHQLYDFEAQKNVQDALVSPEELPMPFIRPAYQTLPFVPLSLLPYQSAYFVFLAVNVVLLGVCFRFFQPRMAKLSAVWRRLPAALFLSFLPVSVALMQGQDSIILLTLLTAAYGAFERGREGAAGVLVGLGLFKFQITLPIGFLFLAWRRWRFSAGFTLAAALVAVISVGVVGLGETRAFANSLLSVGVGVPSATHQAVLPVVVTLMGNLHGLVSGIAGERPSIFWVRLVTAALSVAVLIWLVFGVRQTGPRRGLLALAVTGSAVVSYYLYIHDLTVLLIPILVTLEQHITAKSSGDAFGLLAASAAMLMFISPIFLLVSPPHFFLVAVPLIVFLFVLVRNLRYNESRGAQELTAQATASLRL